jgi:hypothetical protein
MWRAWGRAADQPVPGRPDPDPRGPALGRPGRR